MLPPYRCWRGFEISESLWEGATWADELRGLEIVSVILGANFQGLSLMASRADGNAGMQRAAL